MTREVILGLLRDLALLLMAIAIAVAMGLVLNGCGATGKCVLRKSVVRCAPKCAACVRDQLSDCRKDAESGG
ncbi:MAG: hypothetical protein ACPGWS_05480 [Solirubrobacterales bacterium]